GRTAGSRVMVKAAGGETSQPALARRGAYAEVVYPHVAAVLARPGVEGRLRRHDDRVTRPSQLRLRLGKQKAAAQDDQQIVVGPAGRTQLCSRPVLRAAVVEKTHAGPLSQNQHYYQ